MFSFLSARLRPTSPKSAAAPMAEAAVASSSSSSSKAAVPLRGYKCCNTDRSRKYGVAANSLEMLRTKAALKLKIADPRVYVAKDGTEVADEEYFSTLEPQTLLVIAGPDEIVATDIELIYASIRSQFAHDAGRVVQDFVNDNRQRFAELLLSRNPQPTDDSRQLDAEANSHLTMCSLRTEHTDWFTGQPAAMNTKEKVMRRRSQDRIRGYFYKTKDELLGSAIYKRSASARRIVRRCLAVFLHLLGQADHFGQLFNRRWPHRHHSVHADIDAVDTAQPSAKKRRRQLVAQICDEQLPVLESDWRVAICDERGRFRCQGVWNAERCAYDRLEHSINPYETRESAILFQIWNLDHGAELTRTVIPDLLRTIAALATAKPDEATGLRCSQHGRLGCEVAMVRYFRELFTMDNLRLVHIVCHDKTVHRERRSDGGVLCDRCDEFGVVRRLCEAVEME